MEWIILKSKKSLILIIIVVLISVALTITFTGCNRVRTATMEGDLSEIFYSVSELKEAAELIVVANVIHQETIVYAKVPFTISRVKILSTIKGSLKEGEEIKVIETGGKYNYTDDNSKKKKGEEVEVTFEGVRVMQPGENLILFMRMFSGPQMDDGYVPLGVFQGKFKINKDNIVEKQAPEDYAFTDYDKPLAKEEFIGKLK